MLLTLSVKVSAWAMSIQANQTLGDWCMSLLVDLYDSISEGKALELRRMFLGLIPF